MQRSSIPYSTYLTKLAAQTTLSAEDKTALKYLPSGPSDPVGPGTMVSLTPALQKALNPPNTQVPDATILLNCNWQTGICYDNRVAPLIGKGPYDLMTVVSHEIDEVLGGGSAMDSYINGDDPPTDIEPLDLFRYSAPNKRSYDTLATTTSYFSIDAGQHNLVGFNQFAPDKDHANDFGDWFSNNGTGADIPRIQDSNLKGGVTPNLGIELTRLDVLGYTLAQLDAPVVTSLSDQTASEGTTKGNFDLGILSTPLGDPGPFAVDICWGDGSSDRTFVANAGTMPAGSHTYTEESLIGTPYVVTVTVTDFTGQSDSKTFKVSVSDPQLTNVTGVAFNAVEGTGTYEVAAFDDPGGIEYQSGYGAFYSATIDWGDSSPLSAGTITYHLGFHVQGEHHYSEEGKFDVKVMIQHESLPLVTTTSKATVSDPSVNAMAGASPVVLNASFEDPQIGFPYYLGFESLADIMGWNFSGFASGDSPLFNTKYGTAAGDGNQFVTMGGDDTNAEEASWDQVVSGFIPNHLYTLTFQMASEQPETGTQQITVDANAANTDLQLGTFSVAASPTDFWSKWTLQSVQFTAIATTMDIRFSAKEKYKVGLDDIRITDTSSDAFVAVEGAMSSKQTVATFRDPGGPESTASYAADIDWGDGNTTTGATISLIPSTDTYIVQGCHTYRDQGTYLMKVTIHHEYAPDVVVTETAIVSDPPVLLKDLFPISTVEGFPLSNYELATFTDPGDPNGLEPITDYSASIYWPDGNPTQATITGPVSGVYTVWVCHTAAEEGVYFRFGLDGMPGFLYISHEDAPTTVGRGLISVSDPEVIATGVDNLTFVEGSILSLLPGRTLATFTDPGGPEGGPDFQPADISDNYTTDIDWGDTTNHFTTPGTIIFDPGSGIFSVKGNHTYFDEGAGNYTITVTIHHEAAPDVVVTSTANVFDPPVKVLYCLTTQASVPILGFPPGIQRVASFTEFTDPGGPETIDDYSATITWADNTTSPGFIIGPDQNGTFEVSGDHQYATTDLLNAPVSVTIFHEFAPSTTVTSTTLNTFGLGLPIPILLKSPSHVFVTGTPLLKLNSGGTAAYSSGSGSNILTFIYVVGAGDFTPRLDYTSTDALTLNGGTMTDSNGLPIDLTLPAPGSPGSLGASTNMSVDAVAPTVLQFNVLFGSKSYNLIGSTRFDLPWQITGIQVVFSKPIASGDLTSLSGLSATVLTGLGTNTLTWTFAPLVLGDFATTLFGTGPDALKDALGNPLLDGAGFKLNFRVLYGDFNGDGVVTSADLGAIYAATALPYNLFADLNGDGKVDIADVQEVRRRFGTRVS
jgi:hypothetical protein